LSLFVYLEFEDDKNLCAFEKWRTIISY
jgi:hypothetical protein